MQGSPPPPDKIIRFADGSYQSFPQWRWSVCHFQQLMPTKPVSRGMGAPRPLVKSEQTDIETIRFTPTGATEPMTFIEAFDRNFTDGIIILHEGRIVYERYAGCLSDQNRHAAMSVTKSLIGLLAEILIAEGTLDENRRVDSYVPELAASAFGDATVRQVLDMTTGLQFSEDYADPTADVWRHAMAGNPLPKPSDYAGPRSYYEYLVTVRRGGAHGVAFGYKTVNTDTMGWILNRVTGRPVSDLLAERIWSRIGADLEASFTVDSIGTPFAGGGFNAGLRDLARVGQLLLDKGVVDGNRVVPEAAVTSIQRGGNQSAFAKAGYSQLAGWSYRSMWWATHNKNGAFMARGVYGQSLYVDPAARAVIARFASHPEAGNAANDPTTLPLYQAIADHLLGSAR
ncbi:serine hydrolase domain-containing protein [Microvirga mediterraneensis]|nr:serine hydrolase [Microvirga mediterraneensis]